jgi:integrase
MNTTREKRARATRQQLTDKLIERIPVPTNRRVVIHDLGVKELALKIEPTGTRTFFWYRTVNGKPVFKTIGAWPETPLTNARIEAQKLNVAKTTGVVGNATPFPEAKPTERTFGEIAEQYVVDHVLARANRPDEAAKYTRWAIQKYLTPFLTRSLSEITRKEVVEYHAKLGREVGHSTANVRIKLMKIIFNWAVRTEKFNGKNPAILGKEIAFKAKVRERYLKPDELARLAPVLADYRKSDDSERIDLADFIALGIACGLRKVELASCRWEYLNAKTGVLMLPESKQGPKAVVLSREAKRLFDLRFEEQGNPKEGWIFPRPTRLCGYFVPLHAAFQKLMARSGIKNIRVHDLRHTFASRLANSGASGKVIMEAGAWKSLQSVMRYTHIHDDTVQAALEASERKSARDVAKARRQQRLSA